MYTHPHTLTPSHLPPPPPPQGDIYVNGVPMEEIKDWYIANTGYVLQLATPYYEELTVRENLTLAAKLRLPSSLSSSQLFERVERVMREVGGEGVRV